MNNLALTENLQNKDSKKKNSCKCFECLQNLNILALS